MKIVPYYFLVGWFACLAFPSLVSAQQQVPGMRQADRHNPFSPRYVDMTPGGYARRQGGGVVYGTTLYGGLGNLFYPGFVPYAYDGFHGVEAYDYYHSDPGFYGALPPPAFGYGYGSFRSYPLVIPSEQMFGLNAALRHLPLLPGSAARNIVVVPREEPGAEPKIRQSNAETRARAGRFMTTGDGYFAQQRYSEANQRYKLAAETAPDLLEPYLLQGQALLALGQFEASARAFKRALRLDPGWPAAVFDLAALYGENRLAKQSHLEELARRAEQDPRNPDLLVLLGLQLHFDGQPQRAAPFFERAMAVGAEPELNLAAIKAAPIAADVKPPLRDF